MFCFVLFYLKGINFRLHVQTYIHLRNSITKANLMKEVTSVLNSLFTTFVIGMNRNSLTTEAVSFQLEAIREATGSFCIKSNYQARTIKIKQDGGGHHLRIEILYLLHLLFCYKMLFTTQAEKKK